MKGRLAYWGRIASAYFGRSPSNLSFWHESPQEQPGATFDRLGPYYMSFEGKAAYAGPFDGGGVPQLDYRGSIGVQYNPIAVAQFGLAHANRFLASGDADSRERFLRQADWLTARLERNAAGLRVWMHHFDFEYRDTLRAPWYSALAQGAGISLLARAHASTGEQRYMDAMREAYEAIETPVDNGGVLWRDSRHGAWLEEYIVAPPTHVLNGFMWALWGVKDYWLSTGDPRAARRFEECAASLERRLGDFDTGYWSLYEESGTALPMLSSPYYHRLHIVQLRIMHKMTGRAAFSEAADRWSAYAGRPANRALSLALKCAFKVFYY